MHISPDQARQNSEASVVGVKEALHNIYRTIETVSKTGAREMATGFNKDAINSSELGEIIQTLKSEGWAVTVTDFVKSSTVTVSW
ncbi:hypothetical protein D0436_19670 [Shewanella decolorationis]|uniref:Uncharacterized protein n=1 Tax=Shewanella decolorationis TaxID=256839 RepID=A0A5B8R102_9GAMM|nr:hypothetical protein [Shewanella decolorationis]QDZ92500.1 hypothetical protein D0436_19670 [Shewanella decolorationis]